MTYADLYKPALKEYSEKYSELYRHYVIKSLEGMQIKDMMAERDSRQRQLDKYTATVPEQFGVDLNAALQEYYAPSIAEYQQKLEQVEIDYARDKERLVAQHEDWVRQADEFADMDVAPIRRRHEELLSYKPKLREVLLQYGISPADVAISDDISREEYVQLLDASIAVCKKMRKKSDLSFLRKVHDIPQEDKLTYLILLTVGVVVLAPIALVAMFGYMYFNTIGLYRNLDKLRIAESLMYDTDFSKFMKANPRDKIPALDFAQAEEDRQQRNLKLLAEDPHKEIEKIQAEIRKNMSNIQMEWQQAVSNANRHRNNTLKILQDAVTEAQKAIDEYMAKVKPFGSVISEHPYMSRLYTLGQDPGPLDIKAPMEFKSYTFIENVPNMLQFVKLMMCNAILSVKEKHLYVTVYDPMHLGSKYAEFFDKQTADYIDVKTADPDKVIQEFRDYVQENIKVLDGKEINAFNKEAEELKKVTRDYKLLVVASGAEDFLKNKAFIEMASYSHTYGVAVWFVAPTPVQGIPQFNKAFPGISNPYPADHILYARVMNTYINACQNSKIDIIDYKSGFADRYIPEKETWTHSTNKGINLHFGLADGDPTKGYPLALGDDCVHGLMVGATGAGKSAAINQMLATLLQMYSPEELELVMVDFKNIEFSAFTNAETGRCFIPHARIIAGTKDGEYAISVFEYLMEEMTRRTKVFASVGVEKLENYNKLMRSQGHPERCMPRILVLIDEFQVMFTEVDNKSVDIIKKYITSLSKLARFCGCHMYFTSQSMAGTMSKDILEQFGLRVALRCSKDTSTNIIGSDLAGKIKTSKGYLYTNTSGGQTKDSNTLWRIPFLTKDDAVDLFKRIEQKAIAGKHTHHNAFFYDENRLHSSEELYELYKQHDNFTDKPRLFILGERTGFSLNNAPVNVMLQVDDGENVAAFAFETKDMLNLCATFFDNIKLKPTAKLFVSCADKDTSSMLELDNRLPPELYPLSASDIPVSDLLDAWEGLIDSRASKSIEELTPVYIMCIQWEKMRGIGRDENYKLIDRLKAIAQKAPKAGVHFLFIGKSAKDLPNPIHNVCNHKIAAKVTESDSYKVLNSGRAEKLPDTDFAIHAYGSTSSKFKIYQHTFSRKLAEREITL